MVVYISKYVCCFQGYQFYILYQGFLLYNYLVGKINEDKLFCLCAV